MSTFDTSREFTDQEARIALDLATDLDDEPGF